MCRQRTGVILVVDDDAEIRDSIGEVLEPEGYSVAHAENGEDALTWLKNQRDPCLILLDLMMPVMDGCDFLHRLRQDASLGGLPVVVVSAWPRDADRIGALTQGYVRKPLTLQSLLDTVQRFC